MVPMPMTELFVYKNDPDLKSITEIYLEKKLEVKKKYVC